MIVGTLEMLGTSGGGVGDVGLSTVRLRVDRRGVSLVGDAFLVDLRLGVSASLPEVLFLRDRGEGSGSGLASSLRSLDDRRGVAAGDLSPSS